MDRLVGDAEGWKFHVYSGHVQTYVERVISKTQVQSDLKDQAAAVMQVPRDLASHRQSHGSRSSLILNDHGSLSVTERLDRIESMLGLQHSQIDDTPVPAAIEEAPESEPEDAALAPLWSAVSVLRSQASFGSDPSVWKHSTIKQLWQS